MGLAASVACCSTPQFVASRPATPAIAVAQAKPMQLGDPPLIYEETEQTDDHRYVGGTAYVLIDALPDQVMRMLEDTNSFWHVLPRVSDVKPLGFDGADKLVEIAHGTSVMGARYTVRIRAQRQGAHKQALRFWMEPTRPHTIKDADGSFRVEPYGEGQTLFTWKIRIDLGAGLTRWLFEEKVRRIALTTPALMRKYVQSRRERPVEEPKAK
jgi:carbon monoxide dehydrogenase subunit G